MTITVSLNDVLIFILSIAGIALLLYLAIALNNINSILKDVRYIFNKNKNDIDDTITSLPGIAANIKGITEEVREEMQTLVATAKIFERNVSLNSIAERNVTAVDYVQIISEIIKTGINYLQNRK